MAKVYIHITARLRYPIDMVDWIITSHKVIADCKFEFEIPPSLMKMWNHF